MEIFLHVCEYATNISGYQKKEKNISDKHICGYGKIFWMNISLDIKKYFR